MTNEEFQDRLRDLQTYEYREEFGASLCDLYVICTQQQRESLRTAAKAGTFGAPKLWKYPTAYGRSDLPPVERVRQNLIGKSIHGISDDCREDLCELAHYYHSAAVCGLDADGLLEEIAQLSDPEFAELIRSFTRRSPEEKSMKAWSLGIIDTPEGKAIDRIP